MKMHEVHIYGLYLNLLLNLYMQIALRQVKCHVFRSCVFSQY